MMDINRFVDDVNLCLWRFTVKHHAMQAVRAGRVLPGVWRTVRDENYRMRVRAWAHHAETSEPRPLVRRDATMGAVLFVASMMGG